MSKMRDDGFLDFRRWVNDQVNSSENPDDQGERKETLELLLQLIGAFRRAKREEIRFLFVNGREGARVRFYPRTGENLVWDDEELSMTEALEKYPVHRYQWMLVTEDGDRFDELYKLFGVHPPLGEGDGDVIDASSKFSRE